MPAAITDVYLDVNKAWTRDDVEKVWETVKEKRVWTYDQDDLIAVTAAGKEALFTRLRKKQFSLFPFHLVGDREKSLVITKGDGYSPNLDDLQDSRFIGRLRSKADDPARIRLYDLGAQLPPYLRTLKEFRLFDYEKGDPAHLGSLIREERFVRDTESSEEVIIHEAGLVITRAEGAVASSAPDHLMRLFAYNQVMQQLKGGVLKGMPENEPVVAMAREAYVVSPVSSLIVLETQRDYDRFNIKDGDNSLQNASMKNKGAVPEPGEWALIVLAAAFLIFFVLKFKIL
jgi:XrtN system VIT domain protein